MFQFLRWLFLVAVIVALVGFIVGVRVRGRTPAEELCRLADSAECAHYAERGELLVKAAERRFHATQSSARREPSGPGARQVRPGAGHAWQPPVEPVGEPTHAPLDQHSDSDRRALDRILNQRGSR